MDRRVNTLSDNLYRQSFNLRGDDINMAPQLFDLVFRGVKIK